MKDNPTSKTIQRALSDEVKRLDGKYLENIAKSIDVDPRYLAGCNELKLKYGNNTKKYLACIDFYPFYRWELSKQKAGNREEWVSCYLSAFNISYFQIKALTPDKQNLFFYDLVNSTANVIKEHFSVDAFGDSSMSEMNWLLSEYEDWMESYNERVYADTILRKKYTENTPAGETRESIMNMSPVDLIALDIECQQNEIEASLSDEQKNGRKNNYLSEKYKNIPWGKGSIES